MVEKNPAKLELMIIYDLTCEFQHAFEGWFKNSEDMLEQRENGLLTCPYCDSSNITKKVAAPKVNRKSNTLTVKANDAGQISGKVTKGLNSKDIVTAEGSAAKFAELQRMLGKVHDYVDVNFQDVGNRFAEEAISMHHGKTEEKNIKGTVSSQQMEELAEEGVAAVVLPPKPINKKKLN